MSLAFARSRAVTVTSSSSRLLANNMRAFQSLSAPTKPTRSNRENEKPKTHPMQTVSALSLSTIAKAVGPSSPSFLNATTSIAQATRSMAGVPDSENFRDGKPTLEYAKKMTKTFASMTNDQILHFAELEIPEACRECIVRDVMAVDQIEYDEAMKVFDKIAESNREGMPLAALPFYVGLGLSGGAGYISIPLVFHRDTVEWFNEKYVTSELPPPEDLETWLEVGSASWGWMEPVLGHISFFLLCMQFARSQLQNLGVRPYFNWQRQRRADKLIRTYPQYDAEFLANWSKCDRLSEPYSHMGK